MDWTALRLSLQLAACTTVLLCVIGLPLAYWLTVSRRRWTSLIEAVVALPLVLPPTVLGFYMLLALGPHGPIGKFTELIGGASLAFSFEGLLIASVVYSLPFAVRPFAVAFSSVDRSLVEASWCLGASRLATFCRVVVPLSWTGILTGIILTFVHTIGEFGVVLMVGGNIPGATRTLSISIYDDVQALNYESAGQAALLLVIFSFLLLCVIYALGRRGLPI
jgi:molybdate transport system permease protein